MFNIRPVTVTITSHGYQFSIPLRSRLVVIVFARFWPVFLAFGLLTLLVIATYFRLLHPNYCFTARIFPWTGTEATSGSKTLLIVKELPVGTVWIGQTPVKVVLSAVKPETPIC